MNQVKPFCFLVDLQIPMQLLLVGQAPAGRQSTIMMLGEWIGQ